MDEDRFAEAFAAWVESANPKRYGPLLDEHLPVEMDRALDVGCGPGYLALYLSRAGARRVVGLDRSRGMGRLARRRFLAGGPVAVVGDIRDAPFRPASFDVVAADTVLHDTELDATLPVIRSLVRPGGRVILRDVITRDPARSDSPWWQLLGTLRQAPRYVRELGPRRAWSVLRFEASPTWIRHRAEGHELTRSGFRDVYSRAFPGCTFLEEPWFMTAVWSAPDG